MKNKGQLAQLTKANKLLKESGIYSYCLLTDEQKINYRNKIISLMNELLTNDEIIDKLKITKGCFNTIKKEFNIKRDSKVHQKMIVRQLQLKYGVNNVYELDSVKEKIKQQNIEKYGVEYSWQREDVKEKSKQTKKERYNDENYHNLNQIKQTNLEKYGSEFPFQSEIIKEKRRKNNLIKFNSISPFGNKDIFKKGEETKLNKYGNKKYSNIDKANITKLNKYGKLQNTQKINETCNEKYGIEWPCQLPQCINKSNSISKINQKFAQLLKQYNIVFEQEFILKDKKFDFKVGNTLIEINPTYTHNSTVGCGFNGHYENPLDKSYHLEKSKLAQENGFKCIHVWDWDNWNKIINLLLPKQKIYARNCELKEVSKKECDKFLNMYHLQNTCNSQKIRYGLYYNNELIQIMTFGKPRYNKNYEWELLRLCSHKDYIVIGGSQKLFKHFLKMQKPNNIISYCDNSKFSGDVYMSLGMNKISNGSPAINWSKGIERITNNLLNQRGFDQLFGTNYGKGTSNRELMIENGWREVYDCGQSVWILTI